MAGSNNNGRGGSSKKKLADQFKEVCPPHKRKDLDALIKAQNGDEEKIKQSIREWWEEPAKVVEPEWEEINTKTVKKKPSTGGRGSAGRGRGRGGGAGRGGERGGRRGAAVAGRGAGRGGREGRGRGDSVKPKAQATPPTAASAPTPELVKEIIPPGVPTPVPPKAPQGPWGQPAPGDVESKPAPPPPPVLSVAEPPESVVEMNVVPPPQQATSAPPTPVRSSGNVWATKGSAHLIKAENVLKPPPPPPQAAAPQITTSRSARVAPPPSATMEPPPPPNALESGLSASVNGANINAAGWKPAMETTNTNPNTNTTQLDSLGTTMAQTIVKEPSSASTTSATPTDSKQPEPTTVVIASVSKPPPTNVLNMGHWETDNDDAGNLDFGFGSFGTENETPSLGETTSGSTGQIDSQKEGPPAASPARPPPGLSIGGGAPALPAGAVLVSDLESKLEGASLAAAAPEKTDMPPHVPPAPPGAPILATQTGMNQNYNAAAVAYGNMGMYNYNAGGNGFVAGMHGGQVLAGGIPPKQQTGIAGQVPSSGHLPQAAGGLYGAPVPAADASGDASTATPVTSMPPGMPNAMPAYNPALFYGQQPYQMGQPHGVGGYGYGYGAQFAGAVQGGFGYQQGMMGQSGGYPSYDDQQQQQQQQGNSGGYQKNNSGGYRGRGSGGNQYQNQYNPQGGYAGQPYGMGYHGDHFNQRGGYGPGNMDPYGMQQQQQQGSGNFGGQAHSFQNNDDANHKGGKKVGGRNNGSQFQQQHPQQLGGQQQQQQQSFGRQGGDSNTNSNNNAGGWSGQQAGGWGGPSWQQGS